MLIKSSNDAALTFAGAAQDQGVNLVAKMNVKARDLGMANTHFADAAGLADKDSFSTASDLVKLVRYANNYDIIWQVLKSQSADVHSVDGKYTHHLVNTDKLLSRLPDIIGGKTGYTDTALGTLTLLVGVNNGRDSLISVVLGSNDRFGESEKLIKWGQEAYRWE